MSRIQVLFKTKNKDQPFTLYLLSCLDHELRKDLQLKGADIEERIIISFKELAEYIGYDVKSNTEGVYIDYFIENNMLSLFLDYIRQDRSNRVKVQIIQSLSIILQNVKKEYVFNYLYSGNHINEFIATPLDFENEEILSIYIAFVKYLSNILTKQTVQLFYNKATMGDKFLLFSMSIRFYDNKDAIIRTHVRNIILNCLRIDDNNVKEYMCSDDVLYKYENFVAYCGSLIKLFDELYKKYIVTPDMKPGKLEQCSDEISDQLTFYHDLLDIGVKEVNETICKTLYMKIAYVSCFDSIIKYIKHDKPTNSDIDIHSALFVLTQMLLDVKYAYLVNQLLSSLLSNHHQPLYRTVRKRKTSFHIPNTLTDEVTAYNNLKELEFSFPSDSPMETELEPVPSPGEEKTAGKYYEPGMRGSLISLIGDRDEGISIQTMFLFYTIFTNSNLPPDYLTKYHIDNLVDPETNIPIYNEYFIEMILSTLNRPTPKIITVRLAIWMLTYLLRNGAKLNNDHVQQLNNILTIYASDAYQMIPAANESLLSIYLLSLYTVYTMKKDLRIEVQQCIYMLPTIAQDNVMMSFENRVCQQPYLYLQQRMEIYILLRNFYFDIYSKSLIPQIPAIFSFPGIPSSPLPQVPALPQNYPQLNIYDVDMFKLNNIPAVIEGEKLEINRSNRYISCTILPPNTDITSSTSLNSQLNASDRACYLSIGKTQFILVELFKGSMKEGICKNVFFINEIVEAEVEASAKVLVLKVRSPVYISNSSFVSIPTDIYSRKNIPIYKILLLFPKSDLCLDAQKCLSIARNNDIINKNKEISSFFAKCSNISIDDADISPYSS